MFGRRASIEAGKGAARGNPGAAVGGECPGLLGANPFYVDSQVSHGSKGETVKVKSNLWYIIGALAFLTSASVTEAKDYPDGSRERVTCYQNGQLIFETRDRLRSFETTSAMTVLADVSVGQIEDMTSRLYASERAGVLCVVTNKN